MLVNYNIFSLNERKVKSDEKIDIYRDENYVVVEVLSHRASCKYGAFTGWCISVPHDSTAWDVGKNKDDLHIIFIINKNFKPNVKKIEKLYNLNSKIQNGDATEKDEINFQKLIQDIESHDLSKICVIKRKNHCEIWSADNIDLSDVYYDYKNLPVDEKVINAIAQNLN